VQELSAGNGPKLKILLPPGRESTWTHLVAGCRPERVEILPSMGLSAVKNLLAQANGLISVDGGVMHMGVALGIATLGLFGPTDPSIWFPYEKMGPYRVLLHKPHCHPCDLHECGNFICLPELSVAQVATTAGELFGSQQRPEAEVAP
jgi:ADP-heptose:LPS heptosyltransferase